MTARRRRMSSMLWVLEVELELLYVRVFVLLLPFFVRELLFELLLLLLADGAFFIANDELCIAEFLLASDACPDFLSPAVCYPAFPRTNPAWRRSRCYCSNLD